MMKTSGQWGFWARVVAASVLRRLGRLRIIFCAVALSVMILVFLQAFVDGLSETIIGNCIRSHTGHVQASWDHTEAASPDILAAAERLDGCVKATARTRSIGVLAGPRGNVTLSTIYGVDPAREAGCTFISQKVFAGSYLVGPDDILLGQPAADSLKAQVGDRIQFRRSDGSTQWLVLGGIFRTGIQGIDSALAFTRPQDACDSREISLFLASDNHTSAAADRLRQLAPQTSKVHTWRQIMPDLVQLTVMQKTGVNLVMALVTVLMSLGMWNTIYASVSERSRELGILKAVGLGGGRVALLVEAEAAMLVVPAALGGAIAGAAAVWATAAAGGIDLSMWTDQNPMFAGSTLVVPVLTPGAVLLPLGAAVAGGLLAGLLPARRAAKLQVAQTMRTL